MHKLLEKIKEAKAFSEIYPELKEWKKCLKHFAFVDFDIMCNVALVEENFNHPDFLLAVNSIREWREETTRQFKVNYENFDQKFQIDFAFPFAPPFEHIVEAENRMFVVCLMMALKSFNEQKLYQEFEYFKKAHERHWTITPMSTTFKWAICPEPALSTELKSNRKGALSFL